MYAYLIFFHSIVRWLVLGSLLFAIFRSYRGYSSNAVFTRTDNSIRHWTATIAHIQLTIGSVLYFTSPMIKFFLSNFKEQLHNLDLSFFGVIHILLMTVAVVLITIGSAKAKGQSIDQEKFRTMLVCFSIALVIIFIAIPWPFSPLAGRPFIRIF